MLSLSPIMTSDFSQDIDMTCFSDTQAESKPSSSLGLLYVGDTLINLIYLKQSIINIILIHKLLWGAIHFLRYAHGWVVLDSVLGGCWWYLGQQSCICIESDQKLHTFSFYYIIFVILYNLYIDITLITVWRLNILFDRI